MRSKYALIIAAAIAADQTAKAVSGKLGLIHTANAGVAFGLMGGMSRASLIFSSCVLIFLLCAVFLRGGFSVSVKASLALASGGAAANLIDRVLSGAVTDWIFLPFSYIVFNRGLWINIADIEITLGIAAAIFFLCLDPKSHWW